MKKKQQNRRRRKAKLTGTQTKPVFVYMFGQLLNCEASRRWRKCFDYGRIKSVLTTYWEMGCKIIEASLFL